MKVKNFKNRTVCKNCYNKNRRKNNKITFIQNQQTKIDKINNNNDNNPNVSTYENLPYVVFGPKNVGKICYILKKLQKTGNQRPIYIITRPLNQYPNCKATDINPIHKYKGSVVIFDDLLGARNSSQIDEFYTKSRQEDLSVFYVCQRHFDLSIQSIRNNSDRLILFKQTLGDIQSMYYDIGAYDMNYDEFKELCHKSWSEKFNYLCIDMTKIESQGKYRICNESKTNILNIIPKLNLYDKIKEVSIKKYRRFEEFRQVTILTKSGTSSKTTR